MKERGDNMRILVISDSHGQLGNLNEILKEAGKVDRVIHLGDAVGQDEEIREMCGCPVTIVRGNCDFYSKNELVEIVEEENVKIFATHGHRFNVEYSANDLCNAAREEGCSVALYWTYSCAGCFILQGCTCYESGKYFTTKTGFRQTNIWNCNNRKQWRSQS